MIECGYMKRKDVGNMSDNMSPKKQQIIESAINMELVPVFSEAEVDLTEYKKIPVAELSLLGAGIGSILPPFRTITQNIDFNNGRHLYEAFDSKGNPSKLMYQFKGSTDYMGSRIENGITAQSHFREVPSQTMQTVQQIPIDPATLMMAMVLIDVERKLDKIQETQQDILEFIRSDKISKMEGNATFLADILNNYKYNWNDETYRANMHIKVLDIRQEAEQNINFYSKQITAQLGKRNLDVKGKMTSVQAEFRNYQLALYLYGFSSFLEVMLLANFDEAYLNSIHSSIEKRSFEYRDLYTKCYDSIEDSSQKSLQSTALKGLAKASGALGQVASKNSKLGKYKIGEGLLNAQNKLEATNVQTTQSIMTQFANSKDSCVYSFITLIDSVNAAYNQPKEMITDGENLYVRILTA